MSQLDLAMSDLHKKLFHKQNDISFGLQPLQEDPHAQEEPTVQRASSSMSDDESIESFYIKLKEETFPIRDVYVDAQGLRFQTYFSPPPLKTAPILVCHHGAGSSSMTYCWLAHQLQTHRENDIPGIFVFDARGHGNSSMTDPVDFSLNSLTNDFSFVLHEFTSRHGTKNSIFLVGHSLGGAILTNFLTSHDAPKLGMKGLVMIDIVEETAVKALISISHFINRRPKSFKSYGDAVQWHLHSQLLRNGTSAKLSVTDLLRRNDEGMLVWKSDLSLMADFWDSWFTNLSDNFIKCGSNGTEKVAKLLILSGNETLDKDLIIGQMQGKFQLIVFNNTTNTGHFLQEDIPMQVGISIMEFVRRNNDANQLAKGDLIQAKWGGKIHH